MNYIFAIFHRLNKSGEKLNNQEIRNCIYGGKLNKLLRKLDEMEEWRKLNLMRPSNKYRFVKQGLILRFFAFFYEGEKYKGMMAEFLNDFIRKHQEDKEISLQQKKKTFERTVQVFLKSFDDQKLRHIPANVLCPTMVGIAKNIDVLEKKQPSDIRKCYQRLLEDKSFQEREGLANVKTIKNHLKVSEDIFDVQA